MRRTTLRLSFILAGASMAGCPLTDVAGISLTSGAGATTTTTTATTTETPLKRDTKRRFLQADNIQSGVITQLANFADFVTYTNQNVAEFDAAVIDADAVSADGIRDHALVIAALSAGIPVIVLEPSDAHNEQLIQGLVGMSPAHTLAAVLLDRVPDSAGRTHWAIIEGGGPLDGHPYKSDSQALSDEHYHFAAAVLEYLENGRFEMQQRVEPNTAKRMATAADSETGSEENLSPPVGAKYKHVYQVITGRATALTPTTTVTQYNWTQVMQGYTPLLTQQGPSHSISNSWHFYHNDGGDPTDDFNGQDCYAVILHQRSTFSVGPSGPIKRGGELGYIQDSATLRTTPYTYPQGNPSQLTALPLQVEDTSPTNVNQTTHQETTHATSTTKTLSFGVSNSGISAGGEISQTNSVSFSTSRDVSDWGILNLADPGSGITSWVFHQQTPCDSYQGDLGGCWDGSTPKSVPALSQGSNTQETITVWSTIGVDPSDAARDAYRMAFTSEATQSLRLFAVPKYYVFFFNLPIPTVFSTTVASSRTYSLELSDAFFALP